MRTCPLDEMRTLATDAANALDEARDVALTPLSDTSEPDAKLVALLAAANAATEAVADYLEILAAMDRDERW